MARNPDLSFAIEESSPLKGTYADARPLGPVMELGRPGGPNNFTPERSTESAGYWRDTAQRISSELNATDAAEVLKAYSHDAVAAANLLSAHNYVAEAEETYRLAAQIWPEDPKSVSGLADLLANNGRGTEARQVLEEFIGQHPNQRKDLERMSATWRLFVSAPAQKP
jgi:hypothetical protein